MIIPFNDGYDNSYLISFCSKIRDQNVLFNFLSSEVIFDKSKSKEENTFDWYTSWFDSIIKVWKDVIPNGSIALDIGANMGDTSVPMAALCGVEGKCLAFEPGPTFRVLEEQKRLNPHLNLDVFNFGIAEEDSYYNFLYNNHNGGIVSPEIAIGYFPRKERFECKNLIRFLHEKYTINDIRKVKFIKLDTEGYDLRILESISSLIKSNRPNLYIEWWCGTEKQIVKFLQDYHYYPINPFTLVELPIDLSCSRCDDLLLLPE